MEFEGSPKACENITSHKDNQSINLLIHSTHKLIETQPSNRKKTANLYLCGCP